MASIDLALLRPQAIELADLLDDPALFRTTLRLLMERYAHRLLRRGSSMAQRGALQAWDVPGLLVRELEAALRSSAESRPELALAAADAIWTEGKLEEKLLAVYLAGFSRRSADLLPLLNRWLEGMQDPLILRALSTCVCLPLAGANPTLFRSQLRGWMGSPAPSIRRFGWMALSAWQEENSSESIFAAFDFLALVFSESDPEAVRLAAEILARLARTAPQETRGWIEDQTPKNLQLGQPFVRAARGALPPELSALLRFPHPE